MAGATRRSIKYASLSVDPWQGEHACSSGTHTAQQIEQCVAAFVKVAADVGEPLRLRLGRHNASPQDKAPKEGALWLHVSDSQVAFVSQNRRLSRPT